MSARPIIADELLALARSFVPSKPPPGRPRTAHLRRGASLGYYAVFHELVDHATAELCGVAPADSARRWQASRWFSHSDVRLLAEAATGGKRGVGRALADVLGPPHPHLLAVAEHFCNLQDARYLADYEHAYHLSRPHAAEFVDSAVEAIELARRLRQDGDATFQRFLRLMVGAVKIARTRTG
jgi:hypothetical protein